MNVVPLLIWRPARRRRRGLACPFPQHSAVGSIKLSPHLFSGGTWVAYITHLNEVPRCKVLVIHMSIGMALQGLPNTMNTGTTTSKSKTDLVLICQSYFVICSIGRDTQNGVGAHGLIRTRAEKK